LAAVARPAATILAAAMIGIPASESQLLERNIRNAACGVPIGRSLTQLFGSYPGLHP
jgi:hypothetical protein